MTEIRNERRMTGDELKEVRLSLAYTQKEMAEQLGTPLTTYRNWERFHEAQIRSGTLRAAVEAVALRRRQEIPETELQKLAAEAETRYVKQSTQERKSKETDKQ